MKKRILLVGFMLVVIGCGELNHRGVLTGLEKESVILKAINGKVTLTRVGAEMLVDTLDRTDIMIRVKVSGLKNIEVNAGVEKLLLFGMNSIIMESKVIDGEPVGYYLKSLEGDACRFPLDQMGLLFKSNGGSSGLVQMRGCTDRDSCVPMPPMNVKCVGGECIYY